MVEPTNIPAVVLVRPSEEGNVGSVARAMANMGLLELVLVEPAVAIGRTAEAFAVGAREILHEARRVESLEEALAPFSRVVGTTSSRSRALSAPVVTARELPPALAEDPPGTAVALVFGPESSGLNNEELALCSPIVCVPTSKRQPTLNLAQAVLVVAYELFAASARVEGGDDARAGRPEAEAASVAEVEGLFSQLHPLLERIGFKRDDTAESAVRDLRRLAARAGATSREIGILRGICRRAAYALGMRSDPRDS